MAPCGETNLLAYALEVNQRGAILRLRIVPPIRVAVERQ
jgi:hypothetical protein